MSNLTQTGNGEEFKSSNQPEKRKRKKIDTSESDSNEDSDIEPSFISKIVNKVVKTISIMFEQQIKKMLSVKLRSKTFSRLNGIFSILFHYNFGFLSWVELLSVNQLNITKINI